jgi:molybdate transport system substrate-binding protein
MRRRTARALPPAGRTLLVALAFLPALIAAAAAAPASGEAHVAAAASLKGAFGAMEAPFEIGIPGATLAFAFDDQAAPSGQGNADVIAWTQAAGDDTAGPATLEGPPLVFASSMLAIVVPVGNPGRIQGLADLQQTERRVALCSPTLACGTFTVQALGKAGAFVNHASLEQGTEAVLGKVAAGQADAGVVYVADLRGASGVEGVAVRPDQNVIASFAIGVAKNGPNPAVGRQFVKFVASPIGQDILKAKGFTPAFGRTTTAAPEQTAIPQPEQQPPRPEAGGTAARQGQTPDATATTPGSRQPRNGRPAQSGGANAEAAPPVAANPAQPAGGTDARGDAPVAPVAAEPEDVALREEVAPEKETLEITQPRAYAPFEDSEDPRPDDTRLAVLLAFWAMAAWVARLAACNDAFGTPQLALEKRKRC